MLKWEKKGKIFDPTGLGPFMQNYAQNPNAIELENCIRIYFTTRPEKSKDGFVSYTSFADFDKNNLSKILFVQKEPVIKLGDRGDFDQFGIMPGSIVKVNERNEIWLYYVGWTRMHAVPYNWAIGLAVSYDGGYTFNRFGRGPIICANNNEPYLQACPRVLRLSANNWVMWYQSGTKWNEYNDYMESVYVTMFASSEDGINWKREGKQIIPSTVNEECQTSASVIQHEGLYHMFFSYRHGINFRNYENGYRIGYAYSTDMHTWIRDDKNVGIEVSAGGWDAEMICYPHVTKIGNDIVMFYCGNYFGKEGFGYALLKK